MSETQKRTRKMKRQCFIEAVEANINQVEMVINRIDKIYDREDFIADHYLELDLEESYFDLEITLALLAVLLRKMSENSYIVIPEYIRDDVNALIHSARFEYDTQERFIRVFSRRGEERIKLDKFLVFAKEVSNL